MTIEKMRSQLAEVYPGPNWRIRCQTMPDRQVVAIFKNMTSQNKLYKHQKRKKRDDHSIQLSIFDLPEMQKG